MPRVIQPSFARGEIGADLYGRVDVAPYSVALRTAINAIIHSYGGASNRSGLMFVCPCSTHTGTPPRIIEFKYNTQDTYILEFGDMYMRVIRNDAQVLDAAVDIVSATQTSPVVVGAVAHGYSNGADVYIDGVVGMTELNGRWFTVANKTADAFELVSQQTGANIDGTAYAAYTSAGTVSKVYEIATPYAIDDTLDIAYVQSANVMTLTHTSYPPAELARTGHTAWTLTETTFKPSQAHPTAVTVTPAVAGSTTYHYVVTAVNSETQEESLPGLDASAIVLSSATAANPVSINAVAHGRTTGDEIEIYNFVQMTEVNDRAFTITVVDANNFTLDGEDGTSYAAETTGGNGYLTSTTITTGAATPDNSLAFTMAAGALKHSVYRYSNGLYGWIGDTEDGTFHDDNILPDVSITPPKARNPFEGAGNYPATVSYFEQRRVYGQTENNPDTAYYSVTGSSANMSFSSPRQANDAITATLNSSEVNAIRHFVPGNDLLVFTSGSEWRVNSGNEAAFSAETLRQKPQSSWGVSNMRPIVVGDKTLYFTENASYVRSLGYELAIEGYKGNDMTVFAPHLFRDYIGVDWAKSSSPDPIISVVRSDGIVCTLTFNPEQEVVAWTRWRTKGKFKRVASTKPSSSAVDVSPYFVVDRTVGGSPARYIERVHSRRFMDVRDCFFVDCGLSLNAPSSITNVTAAYPAVVSSVAHPFLDGEEVDVYDVQWVSDVDAEQNETQPDQLNKRRYYVAEATADTFELVTTEGRVDLTGATQTNPIVVNAPAHGRADGDVIGVFNVFGMVELNGNTYKVANSTADTFELTTLADVAVDGTGYTAYTSGGQAFPAVDSSAYNAYVEGGTARKAVGTVGNLWHLEGLEVIALVDGNVEEGMVVLNGSITLPYKASRVHVGLRYVTDLGTLDPEAPSGTIQGAKIRTPFASVRVKDTRGMLIGPDENNLTEMKQREFEAMGEPTALKTGDISVDMHSDWNGGGRVYMRQIYPLPLTLTAVIPFHDKGDTDE